MDHKAHDKVFFVNFGMVLGALFGIFFVCIVAARMIDSGEVYRDPELEQTRLAERLKPAGIVVTDPAALLAMAPAKVARAPYTGEQVVTATCMACHGAGVLDAPKIGDAAAWAAQKKTFGGLDGLVAIAIKGKGNMPPRGGNPDLSDEEVKAAIEHMLRQSGG